MQPLQTDRLILRPFEERDLIDFNAYAVSPHVGPNAGWKPHETLMESAGILRKFIDEDEVWAMVDRASGRVIGSVGLHSDACRDITDVRSLGYVLAEECWGQGFALEAARAAIRYAFDVMGLALLTVYHFPANDRSRRVIEKCGFTHEGTLRMASRLYDGTIMDRVCYSMTATEYAARYPSKPSS